MAWNPGNVKKAAWDGKSFRQDLKHGDDYGCPEEGTKTDKRGRKAGDHISGEVIELCRIIFQLGHPFPPDNHRAITFGHLFEIYTKISNKLVGMLIRARKHGLLEFEGEMLFQRRDDHVVIHLVQIPGPLHEELKEKGLV